MMKAFPFLSLSTAIKLFRIAVAILLLIHGITRIMNGTVGGFGEFLGGFGFPFGFLVAWGITLFEIAGSLALIAGYYISLISLVFIIELLMGILLVHFNNGWFVVGAGTGGMEYSVLLILSFFVIAASGKK
jgi:putative oxidoreductase